MSLRNFIVANKKIYFFYQLTYLFLYQSSFSVIFFLYNLHFSLYFKLLNRKLNSYTADLDI